MRLLFLNHNVIGRGTYVRAFRLARELVALGHEVTLVTTSERARVRVRRSDIDGVSVISAPDLWWGPARTGWDPYNTLRRLWLLRGDAFDRVHAFDSRPAVVLPALRAAQRSDIPLIMDWADWWGRGGRIEERSGPLVRMLFGPVETWFEEAFRLRAQAATTICTALQTRLAGMGFSRERILVLPNGCLPPGDLPTRATARRALDMAADVPLLVHVGVIMQADLALLRAAFVDARTRVPNLQLMFVGNTTRPASELRGDGMSHTGFVDELLLHQWLAAADAGVLPMLDTIGHRGRWPSKLSDYMSAGIPTAMTRVGDAAGLVERAGIGWVADPTPAAFANALVAAVTDRTRAQRGAAARTHARGDGSWTAMADRLNSLYHEVRTEWKAAA